MVDQDLTTSRYSHLDLLAGGAGHDPTFPESKSGELTNCSNPLDISTIFRCRGRCIGELHIIPPFCCLSSVQVFTRFGTHPLFGAFTPIAFKLLLFFATIGLHCSIRFSYYFYTGKSTVSPFTSLLPWSWARVVYCGL